VASVVTVNQVREQSTANTVVGIAESCLVLAGKMELPALFRSSIH
jgi:hypothetical protein